MEHDAQWRATGRRGFTRQACRQHGQAHAGIARQRRHLCRRQANQQPQRPVLFADHADPLPPAGRLVEPHPPLPLGPLDQQFLDDTTLELRRRTHRTEHVLGLYRPVDRIRGRRVLAVDEERGLVIMASIADFGLAQREYTLADGKKVESDRFHAFSRELFEVYKIGSAGRVVAVEAVSVDQPYGMPVAWGN